MFVLSSFLWGVLPLGKRLQWNTKLLPVYGFLTLEKGIYVFSFTYFAIATLGQNSTFQFSSQPKYRFRHLHYTAYYTIP